MKRAKKLTLISLVIVLSLFACGCGKVIDLTDEENHLIAEYAAELLLKYDDQIDLKYYYDAEDEATPTEATIDVTSEETTEATEAATTETATTEQATTEASASETTTQTTEKTTQQTEEEVSAPKSAVDGKSYDLASFLGEDNVSIKYSYYMLLDKYPSYDQDGVYIEIEAPQGYKLLVVKFNVENKTNDSQNVDLYSKGASYKVILDNSKATKQMLTILMDDLYTYQKTLEPSMYEEDVLLFQVSDEVAQSMQDVKLEADYNGSSVVMQLE